MRAAPAPDRSRSSFDGPISSGKGAEAPSSRSRSLNMTQNSVAMIGAKVAVMGLGFAFWIVAARAFEPRTVGLAAGAVSAVMLCTQLALVGLGSSFISHLPEHRGKPSALLDPAITLVILASTLVAISFLLVSGGFLRQLSTLAVDPIFAAAFVVLSVVGTLGILLDQISIALRRGDQALVRNVLSGVVTLIHLVALVFITRGPSAEAVFATWVTGGIGAVALGFRQLKRSIADYRYRPSLERDVTATLLRVGVPNHLLTLTERAPGFILPIAVTELLSPTQNAHWYAAWMMAWVVYIIPIQVGMTLFAEASDDPRDLVSFVRRGLKTSLGLGILAAGGAALVAPMMLSLLGPGYASTATSPMRILLVGVVPVTFIQMYFAICRATRRLREAIFVGAVSALAGTVAAAAFGVAAGLTGMAVAWITALAVTGIWAALRLRSLLPQMTADGNGVKIFGMPPRMSQV